MTGMAAPLLELVGVSRLYGARAAVTNAHVALAEGSITCLLGPSGSGKSTILRMIAGLEPVDAGEIRLRGAPLSRPGLTVPPETRGIGLVFQDNALFPHLNVTANVGFGLAHLPRAERAPRVAALLDQLHIAHLARSWPHMLSGGEAQRVAIARALARRPALLLLDEPFSGLDGALREEVRGALMADLRAAGATVLIVTHDPEEAMRIADHLVLMAESRILQSGPPEACYAQPTSVMAARLLGEVVALPGLVTRGEIVTAAGRFRAPGVADGPATALLRPEHVRLTSSGDGTGATVREVAFAGAGYRVALDCDGAALVLRQPDAPPAIGTRVGLAIDAARIAIIAGAG